jgi:mono/diheme cytochrome c family protein
MRWTRLIALLSLVVTATAAILTLVSATPARRRHVAATSTATKVKRGEYLATVMGCNDCHTPGVLFGAPDFSRRLSGSELGWKGPWGVTFARNITPDLETGIGKWSEAEIVKTLRTGQRPDGSVLLPPMPYQDFAILTDQDAFAIAAYLKSIPPIQHRSPDRIPPGQEATGSILVFPAPGAWDAPRTPPPAGDKK